MVMEYKVPFMSFSFLSALPRINTVRPGKQSQFTVDYSSNQENGGKVAGQLQAKVLACPAAAPAVSTKVAFSSIANNAKAAAIAAQHSSTSVTSTSNPDPVIKAGDAFTSKVATAAAPIRVPGVKDDAHAAPTTSTSAALAPSFKPSASSYTVAEVLRKIKSFMQPRTMQEHQFYSDCYQACEVQPHLSMHLDDLPEVALRLSRLNYKMVLRRVTNSKQYWSKSMTSVFCYCVLPGTGVGYVLDPNFKEHFKTGHMTPRYRDIWECLPVIFVGPPAQLIPLVQLLCFEVSKSFEEASRQLPPWRNFASTIDRWMSASFKDLPAPSPVASACTGSLQRSAGSQSDASQFRLACEAVMQPPQDQTTTAGECSSRSTRQQDGAASHEQCAQHTVVEGFAASSKRAAGLGSRQTQADNLHWSAMQDTSCSGVDQMLRPVGCSTTAWDRGSERLHIEVVDKPDTMVPVGAQDAQRHVRVSALSLLMKYQSQGSSVCKV